MNFVVFNFTGDISRPGSELKVSMSVRPAPVVKSVSEFGRSIVNIPPPAPGTPPHDSLGYFSEPDLVVDCSVSDASEIESELLGI